MLVSWCRAPADQEFTRKQLSLSTVLHDLTVKLRLVLLTPNILFSGYVSNSPRTRQHRGVLIRTGL